jgi:RNA polymerase sigma factor (sigma-70 family)
LDQKEDNIEDIISGCKENNRKAQEKLYRNFYRSMMSLCLRYTKNEADAMEVLNTGFYKVYKNISRYDSTKGALFTWIRTIILNSCLSFISSKETKPSHEILEDETPVTLTPEIFQKFSAAEILKLVRQLPAATQAVFNLYVMDGFNHREIGEMLGISTGTSKWHLSEARKQLQELINMQLRP